MIPDSFRKTDVAPFLDLAAKEGWISDRLELDFLLRVFPQGCFAARDSTGSPGAFITSVSYGRSGWIGNLIVKEESRRCGIGSTLMSKAIRVMSDAGVDTVWLTASEQGAPLYRRIGFEVVDRVERWSIGQNLFPGLSSHNDIPDIDTLLELDRICWGDDRSELLQEKMLLGSLLHHNGACMIVQEYQGYSQIGPWCGTSTADAETQLERLMETSCEPGITYTDVPAGDGKISSLLAEKGFKKRGETLLMYCGRSPRFRGSHLYALASMGSIG